MSILLLYTLAFAFMFGAAIGSFLNVVIYRVPAGLSVVHPPSRCPKCESPIKWYDNIPVLSWCLLGGRCRNCRAPISPRYALVELLTGTLAAVLWYMWAGQVMDSNTVPDALMWRFLVIPWVLRFTFIALLIVIAFVDLDHFIIPHRFTIPGTILGLAAPWIFDLVLGKEYLLYVWPPITPWTSFIGFLLGGLIVVFVFYLYLAARGVEGMGGGDVTLMAMVGAWLGWPALVFIFFAASLQGLIAAGVARVFGLAYLKDGAEVFADDEPLGFRDPDAVPDEPLSDTVPAGKLAVPFGPFIALAAAEFLIFGQYLPPELSMVYLYY